VADLCVSTANGLLSQSHCYILEVAALLHDIGKLGVPDSILHKPGPLTEEEWKVMRSHAQIGEEIVTAAFTCAELTATIRYHHAWYERRPGDTDALTGTDIPLASRILAIADAFDAMVSNRVYCPGRARDAAFAELRRCAGKQFDPELVERFISAVLARDENRSVPRLFVSKQTALQIGLQIEKLANALDAHDIPLLATMAGRLKALAGEHGITPIEEAAARLEKATASSSDPTQLIQWTIDLLELCRSTYGVYFPGTCRWDNRQKRAEASAVL
jgi:hypothetical protein